MGGLDDKVGTRYILYYMRMLRASPPHQTFLLDIKSSLDTTQPPLRLLLVIVRFFEFLFFYFFFFFPQIDDKLGVHLVGYHLLIFSENSYMDSRFKPYVLDRCVFDIILNLLQPDYAALVDVLYSG